VALASLRVRIDEVAGAPSDLRLQGPQTTCPKGEAPTLAPARQGRL